MRKQELLHIHGLLVQVRQCLDERDAVPPGAFDAYDLFAVSPTAIHERKDIHKEAVWYLLAGIDASLTDEAGTHESIPTRQE